MKENYFIIHGSYGNPYKNWIPWLYQYITKKGNKCVVPHFPSHSEQNYINWSSLLQQYVKYGYINENTIFITHSLGGIFAVKFLEQNQIKIKKMITIAGFNHIPYEEKDLYESFYIENAIKNIEISDTTISIYSNNDPYVSEMKAIEFANLINAKKIKVEEAGHFTKKDGFDKLELIKEFL